MITTGCVATEENTGPAGYYRPAGWLNPNATLDSPDFTTYRSRVTQRVRQHRFILDTADPDAEVALVSPVELLPTGSACTADTQSGIAILVHGLSDTAFAMRDLGSALASGCYRSRLLLLPGHGTVPGDLLVVEYAQWLATVRHAVRQASRESDHVVVIGFSLGAVLGLSLALEPDHTVDALVSISPAFHLSSWRLARWAPWLHWLRPWIDRELPDDRFRYEAMPTRGVVETVRAIRAMHGRLSSTRGGIPVPWMLVQSEDDAVTLPAANLDFFVENATDPRSRAIVFRSAEATSVAREDPRIETLPGDDRGMQVRGLTHLAVHISPQNAHYGVAGAYRNCGATGGRKPEAVARCGAAAPGEFDFTPWSWPESSRGRPSARSTFNPQFDRMVEAISAFLRDSREPSATFGETVTTP